MSFIKKWYQDKVICVPKVEGKEIQFYYLDNLFDLQTSTFGVLEPQGKKQIAKKDIDLLIVPLLVFDNQYQRIGYGGGYYDCYLQDYQGAKIGVAFSFQKITKIESEVHDIALDYVIDENSSTILEDLI
jgi:5-formyltetrahydrofolate cyclo-ligase